MHTGYEVEFDFVEDDQVEFHIVEVDSPIRQCGSQ